MKRIFTSLLVIVALSASTFLMAEDNDKKGADSKAKTECCAAKADEKECCKKEDKACEKECSKKEDKKSEAGCCADKKTGEESKSCGKK